MQSISNVLLSCAAISGLLVACGGGSSSTSSGSGTTTTSSGGNSGGGGMGGATSSSTSGTATTSTGTSTGGFTTIFTILMENHDYAEIVGSSNAPYINSLIAQGGLATNYSDSGTHPSLPNYLYMISGDTQYPGGLDVGTMASPWFPSKGDNLGNQMENGGIAWRSYQESMGTACKLTDASPYATKHDPFLYFDDIQNGKNGLCANRNVDYSQFAADLAAGTYKFMWITPNLTDDGHDPGSDPVAGLKQSDSWLSTEVPKILASDAYKNGGVLFITWDEAEGRNGDSKDQIPMIVLSPKLKAPGMMVSTKLSHASWLATIEGLYGFPKLGAAATAGDLMEFFNP
jgi:hypothetical protein